MHAWPSFLAMRRKTLTCWQEPTRNFNAANMKNVLSWRYRIRLRWNCPSYHIADRPLHVQVQQWIICSYSLRSNEHKIFSASTLKNQTTQETDGIDSQSEDPDQTNIQSIPIGTKAVIITMLTTKKRVIRVWLRSLSFNRTHRLKHIWFPFCACSFFDSL